MEKKVMQNRDFDQESDRLFFRIPFNLRYTKNQVPTLKFEIFVFRTTFS